MATRAVRRGGFDDHTRVTLLEDDIDIVEKNVERIETESEARDGHLEDAIKTNTRVLMGVLVSTATAALLLALNIIVTAR